MITTLATMILVAAQSPMMKAVLPSGTVIRVLAVVDPATGQMWAPTGGPVDPKIKKRFQSDLPKGDAKGVRRSIIVDFLPKDPVDEVGLEGDFEGTRTSGFVHVGFQSSREHPTDHYVHTGCCTVYDPGGTEAGLRLGVAEGRFETASKYTRRAGVWQRDSGFGLNPVVRAIAPYVHDGISSPEFNLKCAVPAAFEDDAQTRFRLFNSDGSLVPDGGGTSSGDSVDMTFGGVAKNVVRIEFQRRKYTWAHFKGIRLQPDQP